MLPVRHLIVARIMPYVFAASTSGCGERDGDPRPNGPLGAGEDGGGEGSAGARTAACVTEPMKIWNKELGVFSILGSEPREYRTSIYYSMERNTSRDSRFILKHGIKSTVMLAKRRRKRVDSRLV